MESLPGRLMCLCASDFYSKSSSIALKEAFRKEILSSKPTEPAQEKERVRNSHFHCVQVLIDKPLRLCPLEKQRSSQNGPHGFYGLGLGNETLVEIHIKGQLKQTTRCSFATHRAPFTHHATTKFRASLYSSLAVVHQAQVG